MYFAFQFYGIKIRNSVTRFLDVFMFIRPTRIVDFIGLTRSFSAILSTVFFPL